VTPLGVIGANRLLADHRIVAEGLIRQGRQPAIASAAKHSRDESMRRDRMQASTPGSPNLPSY
jgi:hypothetical protein